MQQVSTENDGVLAQVSPEAPKVAPNRVQKCSGGEGDTNADNRGLSQPTSRTWVSEMVSWVDVIKSPRWLSLKDLFGAFFL